MALFKTLLLALPLALAAPPDIEIPGRFNRGDMNFYTVGLGTCGITNSDTDMVCAISASLYDANSPCGKHIKVTGPRGSVTVKVVNRCDGCAFYDVGLSPAAFQQAIGNLAIGHKGAYWEWV